MLGGDKELPAPGPETRTKVSSTCLRHVGIAAWPWSCEAGFPLGRTPWSWATTVGVSCTAGQKLSRWTQLPSDPAAFETAWQWVTGLLWLSWLPWGSTRSEQETDVPASWSNPTPRPDKWSSVMEKAHFSWRLVLTPTLSYERERHLDVEPPSALIELKSTNRRCNWVCGCPGVAEEPEQHPHTSWKYGVRVLGRKEEPNISKLCPWKQTSGTSCEWKGWRHESMRLLDLSWQTSSRTWSETRPASNPTSAAAAPPRRKRGQHREERWWRLPPQREPSGSEAYAVEISHNADSRLPREPNPGASLPSRPRTNCVYPRSWCSVGREEHTVYNAICFRPYLS